MSAIHREGLPRDVSVTLASSVHVSGPCPLGSPRSASNPSWSSMLAAQIVGCVGQHSCSTAG
jgi:hypothetical protein